MDLISVEKRRFWVKFVFQPLTFYLIPFFLLLWFISTFSVNIPYWDQWSLVDLFERVASGNATFQDFFAQHNEHRILFPKLIIVALAFISKWNILWELYFNLLLGIVILLGIYKITAAQTEQHDLIFHMANVTTCVAIFSLVQWENWLWGFQIAWFLINSCLVLTIVILGLSSPLIWRNIFLAALFCVVASFSSAHGLLTWLAVSPILAASSKNFRHFAKISLVWLMLFFICYQLYLIHYQKPANHPDLMLTLRDLSYVKDYFSRLLGTPILYKSSVSNWAGTLLFLNFGYFVVRWRQRYKTFFFRQAAPWISLGLFPILFSLLVAVGRAGLGLEQASASRYTTVSILLIVALIQLWSLELRYQLATQTHHSQFVPISFNQFSQYCLIIGALMAFLGMASAAALEEARSQRSQLQYGQHCLEIVDHLPATQQGCLETLYPSAEAVRQWSKTLRQLGFINTVKSLAVEAQPTRSHGHFDSPFNSLTKTEPVWRIPKNCDNCAQLKVKGWAINPSQRRAAQLVVLSQGDRVDLPQNIIGTAAVGLPSSDIASALKSASYAYARWETMLSPQSILLGQTMIDAWMYDSVNQKLVKLDNTLKVEVEE